MRNVAYTFNINKFLLDYYKLFIVRHYVAEVFTDVLSRVAVYGMFNVARRAVAL